MFKRKTNARPQLVVQVTMTDRDVIDRAAALMGASVHAKATRPEWTQCWRAHLGGQKAEDLMRLLRPHMGKRRGARIDEILGFDNYSHQERKAA